MFLKKPSTSKPWFLTWTPRRFVFHLVLQNRSPKEVFFSLSLHYPPIVFCHIFYPFIAHLALPPFPIFENLLRILYTTFSGNDPFQRRIKQDYVELIGFRHHFEIKLQEWGYSVFRHGARIILQSAICSYKPCQSRDRAHNETAMIPFKGRKLDIWSGERIMTQHNKERKKS